MTPKQVHGKSSPIMDDGFPKGTYVEHLSLNFQPTLVSLLGLNVKYKLGRTAYTCVEDGCVCTQVRVPWPFLVTPSMSKCQQ